MWNIRQDLRFALRVLRQSPGFTAVAVATLGLGIAANMTVFGWIDAVLLRPIPGVSQAHELAALKEILPDGGDSQCAQPDFRDYQRNLTLVSGVLATHVAFFSIGPVEQSQTALGQVVSANFFTVLGVKPYLGRMLLPDEDRDESGAYPVAVISHRLWRTYYRADPGVVGRMVRINGRQLTLVGVAPPDFGGTMGGVSLDIWVPLSMIVQMGSMNTWAAADRNVKFLDVIVRLKPGVTIERASAEVRALTARMAADYPDTHRGFSASLAPMWRASNGLQAKLRNPLRLLMVVSVLVLLIACANVANLLTARSVTRQREFGIRMALGAGRGVLIRQLLAEVWLLSGAGAVLALVMAQWMGEALPNLFTVSDATIRAAVGAMLHPALNGHILFFTLLISTGAGALSVVMPALSLGRLDVNETLKEGGRSGTAGAQAHRARGALVAVEVALSAVALIGAGLAVRSFQKFAAIHPGFDARHVLVAHFHLSTNGYSVAQEKEFCRTLRLRLETAPGIEAVTYADAVALSLFSPGTDRVEVEGAAGERGGAIPLPRLIVAPGYFGLMRIPILEGRDFTERDDRGSLPVIVVNQAFAERYFDGQSPLGRQVRVNDRLSTVIGLVKDSKYRTQAEGSTAFFYGPFRQIFFSRDNSFFYLRTTGDLDAARAALRREVPGMGQNIGSYEAWPLTEFTRFGLFTESVAAVLLSVLGILSVALAAVGLYSVMAYAVSERTHEIGIRMALGARPRSVIGMVLRTALAMTVPGLVLGVAAALAGVRLVASLFEASIHSDEPAVFAAAAVFLALVALAASYLPARRATKVDPMTTLRSQ